MEAPLLTLVMLRGPRLGETFEFHPGSTVRIGRVVRGNTIGIKDEGISSKHLVIESESGKWTVRDLDSSNGTKLNSEKLSPHQSFDLRDGDQIKLGEVTSILVQIQIDNRNRPPEIRRRRRRRVSSVEVSESTDKVTLEVNESEPIVEVEDRPERGRAKEAKVSEQDVDQHQPAARRIITRSKKNELDCPAHYCVKLGFEADPPAVRRITKNELDCPAPDCVELGFEVKRKLPATGNRKRADRVRDVQELPPENKDTAEISAKEDGKEGDDHEADVAETETMQKPDSSQCTGKQSCGGKAREEMNLETMTARDWFDYMEIQFREQIVEATEEMIAELRKRSDRVREYMIEQKINKRTANVG